MVAHVRQNRGCSATPSISQHVLRAIAGCASRSGMKHRNDARNSSSLAQDEASGSGGAIVALGCVRTLLNHNHGHALSVHRRLEGPDIQRESRRHRARVSCAANAKHPEG
jgi:hypothetical protein